MEGSNKRTLSIEWVEDGETRSIGLPEVGAIRLGRDPECDVVFDELSVSRHHAEIACGTGAPVLRHASRKSPTWLNGQLIIGESPLADGDVIRLSTVELKVSQRS